MANMSWSRFNRVNVIAMDITLTERAASHIKRFLARQGKEVGLRLSVKSAGCSGFSYVAAPAESVDAEDTVFESHGVKVVVDAGSLLYLAGTEVDYVREGFNEGFQFHNPNVKNTCGCGESFNV
jgi:iron-sulfur cluster assembly protein